MGRIPFLKAVAPLAAILLILMPRGAGAQDWIWVGGTSTGNTIGNYGTRGVANVNNFPGARFGAGYATDDLGRFWMYGGRGHGEMPPLGDLADLWMFDPANGLWTWMSGSKFTAVFPVYGMKGVAGASNSPGSRTSTVMFFENGRLWLFGGQSGGLRNDLWKYDIATGLWTWMAGSNLAGPLGIYGTQGVPGALNSPGGREAMMGWSDPAGLLWLFGGSAAGDAFNDLWRYNVGTGQWTWMKGGNTVFQVNATGTIGVPGAGNTPGSRSLSSAWRDLGGLLWLYGGLGDTPIASDASRPDLWRYDPATGEWTCRLFPSEPFDGSYGTKGLIATTNWPGFRHSAAAALRSDGTLWMFAGTGTGGAGPDGKLNDVWRLTPSADRWTWLKEDSTTSPIGDYGTGHGTSPTMRPRFRDLACAWIDTGGDLWIFGGRSMLSGVEMRAGDLWRFHPSATTAVDAIASLQDLSLVSRGANPSRGDFVLEFALPEAAEVSLRIFDIAGREQARIVEGAWPAGSHLASWTPRERGGSPLAAGVYCARLEARMANGPTRTATRKLLVIR